jgi:hypothetical protein
MKGKMAPPAGMVVKVKSNKKEETARSTLDENEDSPSNSCSIMSQEDDNKENQMGFERAECQEELAYNPKEIMFTHSKHDAKFG